MFLCKLGIDRVIFLFLSICIGLFWVIYFAVFLWIIHDASLWIAFQVVAWIVAGPFAIIKKSGLSHSNWDLYVIGFVLLGMMTGSFMLKNTIAFRLLIVCCLIAWFFLGLLVVTADF